VSSILVVDDDPDIRDLVREVLEFDGYEVSEAQDGAVALEQIHQHRPDLVLLDLGMPVMDGWTFLKQCCGEPDCRGVPVVVMSAVARQPGRPSIPERITHFLHKPFELTDLQSTVAQLLAAS